MSGQRRAGIACAALVVAAAGLRAVPCWSEFWLDEIWSWWTARGLASAPDVFRAVHHSNNHHLMTLWIYALGERDGWVLYRLPAWIAGVASVALGAALAWRRDRLEACLAALLLGSCFALVHFSSEARGYAPAVAASLAALWLLERDLERHRPARALAFGACVSLALLSQLVSLFFWAGALAWSGWRLARSAAPARRRLAQLAWLHGLPLAVLAALYQVDLRHFELAGGNPTDTAEWLSRSVGFALGLPVRRALALPYGLLAAALVGAGLARLARRGDDRWLLFAVTIALAPALALLALRPQVVDIRYFLIGIALALLLAADLLAEAWRRGGRLRALGAALLALYLIGHAAHVAAFLRHGRGGYREALLWMARESPGPSIRVASDHDFRNGLVLRFYARELPPDRLLDYRPRGAPGAADADWFVVHRPQRPGPPPASIRVRGRRFELAAEFDHAAISGFYWALYRRSDPVAARPGGATAPRRSPRRRRARARSARPARSAPRQRP